MISRTTIKYVKSLQLRKYRKAEQCFVVEGAKAVRELLTSEFDVKLLAGKKSFLLEVGAGLGSIESLVATEAELERMSGLKTNSVCLAVVRMRPNKPLEVNNGEFAIVLDRVGDPGNLGTILRIADWYGIKKVIASVDSADLYNGKVIQSSMGSFLRTEVCYCDLSHFLRSSRIPVFGAFQNGVDVHGVSFGSTGLLVIGNESTGISGELAEMVHHRVGILRYGGAESLNAAVATAIICDNIRRSQKKP